MKSINLIQFKNKIPSKKLNNKDKYKTKTKATRAIFKMTEKYHRK